MQKAASALKLPHTSRRPQQRWNTLKIQKTPLEWEHPSPRSSRESHSQQTECNNASPSKISVHSRGRPWWQEGIPLIEVRSLDQSLQYHDRPTLRMNSCMEAVLRPEKLVEVIVVPPCWIVGMQRRRLRESISDSKANSLSSMDEWWCVKLFLHHLNIVHWRLGGIQRLDIRYTRMPSQKYKHYIYINNVFTTACLQGREKITNDFYLEKKDYCWISSSKRNSIW